MRPKDVRRRVHLAPPLTWSELTCILPTLFLQSVSFSLGWMNPHKQEASSSVRCVRCVRHLQVSGQTRPSLDRWVESCKVLCDLCVFGLPQHILVGDRKPFHGKQRTRQQLHCLGNSAKYSKTVRRQDLYQRVKQQAANNHVCRIVKD